MKKLVFENGNGEWISELSSVFMKYNITIHKSAKMKPIDAFKKANEKSVHSNLQDGRVREQPRFKPGQLVRTADIKKFLGRVIQQNGVVNYIQSQKLYMILYIISNQFFTREI